MIRAKVNIPATTRKSPKYRTGLLYNNDLKKPVAGAISKANIRNIKTALPHTK
ncbi:hypothetical protein CHS0354_026887, partial [Potamilus streckersoni]